VGRAVVAGVVVLTGRAGQVAGQRRRRVRRRDHHHAGLADQRRRRGGRTRTAGTDHADHVLVGHDHLCGRRTTIRAAQVVHPGAHRNFEALDLP